MRFRLETASLMFGPMLASLISSCATTRSRESDAAVS